MASHRANRVIQQHTKVIQQLAADNRLPPLVSVCVSDDVRCLRLVFDNHFDESTLGGRQLNDDLRQLAERHGCQPHLHLELKFPDDYPTSPLGVRVVVPR
jgi:hypothetical protein